mgnify:CR=1 FL=1
MALVPTGIEKVDRSQWLVYLDTTPAETATWAVLGVGITEFAISYNPQVDTEKWIIEDTARNDHTSNQKQGSVSQKIYKGDPCFEFAHKGLDKLNYKTHILEIDRWNGSSEGKYPAKMSDGIITITQKGGENAVLEYDLYFNGDPVDGEVTFTADVPTFTKSAE